MAELATCSERPAIGDRLSSGSPACTADAVVLETRRIRRFSAVSLVKLEIFFPGLQALDIEDMVNLCVGRGREFGIC